MPILNGTYIKCETTNDKARQAPKALSLSVERQILVYPYAACSMHTASDSTRRSGNTSRWFRTCANILLYGHRCKSRPLRVAEGIKAYVHRMNILATTLEYLVQCWGAIWPPWVIGARRTSVDSTARRRLPGPSGGNPPSSPCTPATRCRKPSFPDGIKFKE